MCYVCVKDDMFKLADLFAERHASKTVTKTQAKAIFIKQVIRYIETNDESRCEQGDTTLGLLRDEQYNLAKQM